LEQVKADPHGQHGIRKPDPLGAIRTGNPSFGRGRQDQPDPVTLQDRFHIGSCGKAMTATALNQIEPAFDEWRL
jgi:CubicO group peptidase (beta-lactamase class C family)